MAKNSRANGRESGTGQDTHKVCVPVPLPSPLRPAGHRGTLSRPVPLSRTWWLEGQPQRLLRPPRAVPTCSRSVLHREAA
jgi:hypothetical protein